MKDIDIDLCKRFADVGIVVRPRSGAAEAVENRGSRSEALPARSGSPKFFLINIHEGGVSTLLRELKWLFVWSLQSVSSSSLSFYC